MERLNTTRRNVSTQRHLFRALAVSLALATAAALPMTASAGVSIGIGVSVGVAPPPLPVYVQPAIPAPGYIWVPGYWAWGGDDYYWVPGTWIEPPYVGALWTPGYWGWVGGSYIFHAGYWGPHVGFYGGINYGFGYGGVGYEGGEWRGGSFYYNRTVNHIDNVHITNVYNRTVVNNVTINRTSFNGGQGGIAARPTPQQESFAREQHTGPVAAQEQQRSMASQNQAMRASVNHGAPSIAATPHAGAFNGPGMVPSHGAAGQPESAAMNAQHANAPVQAAHNDMALHSSGFAPHAGGAAPNAAHAPGESPANHASYTRSTPNPEGGYHAETHAQPSYATHQSREAPAPQYHNYGPAQAPHQAPAPHPQPQPHAQPHPQAAPHHEAPEHEEHH